MIRHYSQLFGDDKVNNEQQWYQSPIPYSVYILHNKTCEKVIDHFKNELNNRIHELYKTNNAGDISIRYEYYCNSLFQKGSGPSVCLYFIKKESHNEDIVEDMQKNRVVIIPVKENKKVGELPPSLEDIHYVTLDNGDMQKLVKLVLQKLGLSEQDRRLFISYKISDAKDLATILYDELSKIKFHVFLDRYDIEGGDDFPTVIEEEIENTSFLLVIESPSAHESSWMEKEVQHALIIQIPVLILSLPCSKQIKSTQNLHRLCLNNTNLSSISDKCGENENVWDSHYVRSKILPIIESKHAEGLKKTHEGMISGIYANLKATFSPQWIDLSRYRTNNNRFTPDYILQSLILKKNAKAICIPWTMRYWWCKVRSLILKKDGRHCTIDTILITITSRFPSPDEMYYFNRLAQEYYDRETSKPDKRRLAHKVVHSSYSHLKRRKKVNIWLLKGKNLDVLVTNELYHTVKAMMMGIKEERKKLSGRIFISASIPQQDRNDRYFKNSNPQDIIDCVKAITYEIIQNKMKVIFGGHPTISPVILNVKKNYPLESEERDIYIYQSKYFEEKISENTKELAKNFGLIVWTKKRENLEESLAIMRKEMLQNGLDAAIFIGGMEGIIKEYHLFKEFHKTKPAYVIKTTGGATEEIIDERDEMEKDGISEKTINIILNSKSYIHVARVILEDIAERLKKHQ